jgi:hypothetical protein
MTIPPDINKWPRIQEVRYYLDNGLLIQPVYGPHEAVKDPGKKPKLSLEDRLALTREKVLTWFSNGSSDNVGQIPDRSHPCVDMDDKSEGGRHCRRFGFCTLN